MIEDVEADNLDAPDDGPDSPPPVDFSHVYPHPDSKTHCVTIEEVEDDDAGWALREGETKFEGYRRYQEEDGEDPCSPFEDVEEWDLA
ncbi:uncharacterized protein EDB93DRAFT_1245995 [Suillus bovinus]|uniref:uncharacterized protein n=1 Tax=Suillus bovinus TaxID=48563 RepID=UPI001B85D1DE|nr:uncharacterized protein EDB93DRAFT_1245995 [Suillus bovinus]KAG2158760.1 hypothetical protein EDB93DRAFT_1245995 [Suillus bovinus]